MFLVAGVEAPERSRRRNILNATLTAEQWTKLPLNVKNAVMRRTGPQGAVLPGDARHGGSMNRFALLVLTAVAVALPATSAAQVRRHPLESTSGLRLHNVAAEPAVLDGKKGLRLTISDEAARRLQSMTPEQQALFEELAVIEGLELANGVIEVEIGGAPRSEAHTSELQ